MNGVLVRWMLIVRPWTSGLVTMLSWLRSARISSTVITGVLSASRLMSWLCAACVPPSCARTGDAASSREAINRPANRPILQCPAFMALTAVSLE